MARQRLAPRIHHDQFGAALGGVLDEGRGDRMVYRRIGADHPYDFSIRSGRERCRHRSRAKAFE